MGGRAAVQEMRLAGVPVGGVELGRLAGCCVRAIEASGGEVASVQQAALPERVCEATRDRPRSGEVGRDRPGPPETALPELLREAACQSPECLSLAGAFTASLHVHPGPNPSPVARRR